MESSPTASQAAALLPITPLLLGPLLSTFLFGILTVQLYFYYLSFPLDAVYIKVIAYSVYVMDTATTVMTISDTFEWFAKGFGNVRKLDNVLLSPVYTPIMGPLIAGTVQSFYCYRIFKIDRRAWPLSAFILLAVLAQVVAGLWAGSIALEAGSFRLTAERSPYAPWVLFISAVVADVTIAGTIIFLLLRRQSETHHHFRGPLSKIIQLTAETNTLSTVLMLTTLILFAGLKGTAWYTLPSFLVGKVYANSLLLILNNRWYLAADAQKRFRVYALGNSQDQHSSGTAVTMSTFKNNPIGGTDSKGIPIGEGSG